MLTYTVTARSTSAIASRAVVPALERARTYSSRAKVRGTDVSTSDVEHPAASKPGWFGHRSETGAGKEPQGDIKYSGLGILDEYDLTFGLEVYLDHARKRLGRSPAGKDEAFVQIQLIPSAGMSIKDEAVVAVKDGVVMNCDGNPRANDKTR